MIVQWFDFLLSIPGSIISALDSFEIVGIGTLLAVIVVTLVTGILVRTFISRGSR